MHHTTDTGDGTSRPHAGIASTGTPEMVMSAEQLTARTEWTVSGTVRFRRRVTSSQRTIEVTVRREELEVEFRHIAEHDGVWLGTDDQGPAVPPPATVIGPGVFVLREEVPEVTLRVRPFERVVVNIDRVVRTVTLDDAARREVADVNGLSSARRPQAS